MASKYSEFRKNKISSKNIVNKIDFRELEELDCMLNSMHLYKTESKQSSLKEDRKTAESSDRKQEVHLVESCELNQTCDITTNTNRDSQRQFPESQPKRKAAKSANKRNLTQYDELSDQFVPFESRLSNKGMVRQSGQKGVILQELRKIEMKIKQKQIKRQNANNLVELLSQLSLIVDNL